MASKPPQTVRSESLRFRVRPAERAALQRLAEEVGCKPSELLRRLLREAITGGPAFFQDGLSELRTTHRQLAAVGRNLNQLAKQANRNEELLPEELRYELARVKDRVEAVSRFYREAILRSRHRSVARVRTPDAGGMGSS